MHVACPENSSVRAVTIMVGRKPMSWNGPNASAVAAIAPSNHSVLSSDPWYTFPSLRVRACLIVLSAAWYLV